MVFIILHLDTLLNCIITHSGCLIDSAGFFWLVIVTSASNDNYVFYFIELRFHTLWNLIALVRIFRKCTSSENSWQSCLFPDFHGNTCKYKVGSCYEIYIILHFKEVPLYFQFAVIFNEHSLGMLMIFFPLSHPCIPKINFKPMI